MDLSSPLDGSNPPEKTKDKDPAFTSIPTVQGGFFNLRFWPAVALDEIS